VSSIVRGRILIRFPYLPIASCDYCDDLTVFKYTLKKVPTITDVHSRKSSADWMPIRVTI
jgi:hypothetical protein